MLAYGQRGQWGAQAPLGGSQEGEWKRGRRVLGRSLSWLPSCCGSAYYDDAADQERGHPCVCLYLKCPDITAGTCRSAREGVTTADYCCCC